MGQNDLLTETFNGIEKRIKSELYSHKSIYDPHSYDSVNFKSGTLTPLINGFFNEIDQLTINQLLINKIEILIQRVESFRDNKLSKGQNSNMIKYQISHLNHLISEFTSKKNEIIRFLENPINDESDPKLLTKLSRLQTALLILYLQEAKAIKHYNATNDEKMCDAFEVLTGYKGEQLRKIISSSGREKNIITVKKELYYDLKEMFLSIVGQIDKDLSSFN
jgi:hypothetical protein